MGKRNVLFLKEKGILMLDKSKAPVETCRNTPKDIPNETPEEPRMVTETRRIFATSERNTEIANKMAKDPEVIRKVKASLDPKRKVFSWGQVIKRLRRRAS